MVENRLSRRHFFYGALLAGPIPRGGFGSVPSLKAAGYKSPNEKLNLAAIGAGGQPGADLRAAQAGIENVVALADVDWERGAPSFKRFPQATRYRDYRRMLDRQAKEIDALIVGPPDHMHATAALHCMQLGKHVYLEKPLTRTAWEARLLTQAAAKYNVATQMGNQGYSHDATRVAAEIFWSGEIGEVREVHAWTGLASWPQGMTKVPAPTPIPDTLDWDLWLGGAEARPFTTGDEEYRQFVTKRAARGRPGGTPDFGFYLPFNWRGFYDFGSSLIGDWGIHILGPANWALQLHPKYLISVECVKKDTLPPFTFPDELTIRYDFGPRPGMPPVSVYWYHHAGGDPYTPPGMTVEEARKIPGEGPQVGPVRGQGGFVPGSGGARPAAASRPVRLGYNSIFVGSKGYLGTSGRGEDVGLLPGKRWAEYKLPDPYLTRSPGASTGSNHAAHCRDFIRACKGGEPACSNFSIAGPFTEWLVLGAAAVHADGKLMWNNDKCEFTNHREVNKWVKPVFRKGWEIAL
ncbi:MAG: Gfo/Idh/MocA family oxidoreductase [Bryobacterales bacterium]|nr:Gfo/Idh/MocA family oxidoreductase [Bryobacterales bacterium]MEB2361434.1 Gfo/Idh/MocA family oxidoreductase [Bryobacterales bacterium]